MNRWAFLVLLLVMAFLLANIGAEALPASVALALVAGVRLVTMWRR